MSVEVLDTAKEMMNQASQFPVIASGLPRLPFQYPFR